MTREEVTWTAEAINAAFKTIREQGHHLPVSVIRSALSAAVQEQELLPEGALHRLSFVDGLHTAAEFVSSITTEMTASEVAEAIRRLA